MASSSDRRSGSSGRSRKSGRSRGRRPDRRRRTSSPRGPAGRSSGVDTRAGAGEAAAKRAEREKRLAVRRRKGRGRLVLAGIALLLALGGLCALYRSAVFTVEAVEVEGIERLTEEEVRAAAEVPDGATLLRFPGAEVRERVEAHPWIESATVSRDFPDTMRIVVVERTPVALVDLGEEYLLVDAGGHQIEFQSLEETSALVVVRDLEGLDPQVGRRTTSEPLLNALAVLAGLSDELRGQVRAISVRTTDETALLTTDGVEITFGIAEDVETKDAVARQILEEQEGRVVFIDVRTVDRPIFRGLEEE